MRPGRRGRRCQPTAGAQVSSVGVRLSENRRGSRAFPPWWVERRVSESPPSIRSRFQSRSALPSLPFRGGTPSRGSRGLASASSAPKGRHPFCLFSPDGAPSLLPLQPRWGAIPSASSAPKGRHPFCLFSPEGAPSLSPGQRPGYRAYPRFSAPKGRHSWPRGDHGLSVCRPGRAQSRFGFHSQGGALG